MSRPPSPPILVVLVDDHTMVRRGLATFLRVFDDLELTGEAAGSSPRRQPLSRPLYLPFGQQKTGSGVGIPQPTAAGGMT